MLTYPIKVLIFSSGQNKTDPLFSLLAKEPSFELSYLQNGKLSGAVLKEKTPDVLLIDLSPDDSPSLEIMDEIQSLNLNVPLVYLGDQAQFDFIKTRFEIQEEKQTFLNKKSLTLDLLLQTLRHHAHLGQKEEELAEIQKLAHIGSWNLNLLSNKLTWSGEQYSIFGLSDRKIEPTFDLFINAVHPDDREGILKMVENAKLNRKPYGYLFRIIRIDGTIRFIQSYTHVAIDGNGQVVRLYGTAQDITEEKSLENNLRQSANLLKTILEETKDTIFIKDLQGRYLLVNDAGAANFGKTPQELIGKDNSILDFPPETAKKIEQTDQQVILTGETLTYEITVNLEEGKRTFLSTKSPYRDHSGKTIGVIAITRDITERKLMEEKLRLEHAYRKPIEEAMLAGVAAVNLEGEIIYVNPSFCEMVGWKEEELIGSKPPHPFWPPEEMNSIQELFRKRVSSGKMPKTVEYRFQRKNGSRFDVLVLSSPLTDGHGNKIGIVSTFTDITEKKKMEEELIKAGKLESLGLLAGGIAHDFNNILTGIMGNLSLAKASVQPGDEIFTILNEAESASDRAAGLARQLLTFAKGGKPVKTRFLLKELLEKEVHFSLSGSHLQSRFEIQNDLWPVEADIGQLGQVIQNLVINAKQAMPEGGTVSVKAKNILQGVETGELGLKEEKYVRVSIGDNGPGIPLELHSKIFDPYFTTKAKGNGLGLSIVYSILKKHGGLIKLESNPGEGTLFHFYLPAPEPSEISHSLLESDAAGTAEQREQSK